MAAGKILGVPSTGSMHAVVFYVASGGPPDTVTRRRGGAGRRSAVKDAVRYSPRWMSPLKRSSSSIPVNMKVTLSPGRRASLRNTTVVPSTVP